MTTTPARQPKGRPTGGQFAAKSNPESAVELFDVDDWAAAINPDQQLYRWLGEVRARLASGEMPSQVTGPFGTHGVTYGEETGEEYATIGFCLPDGVYAEVEDCTYGQLQGLRVILDESDAEVDTTAEGTTVTAITARSFQDVLEDEGAWSWTAIAAEVGKPAAEDLYERSGGSLGRAMAMAWQAKTAESEPNGQNVDRRVALPPGVAQSAMWFTAQAVREHLDEEEVEDLSDEVLAKIGQEALESPVVWDAFDESLREAIDQWRNTHCACGNSLEDGEGWDGKCGSCADKAARENGEV